VKSEKKKGGLIVLNLNHKKLDVWRKSIQLVKKIYAITEHFPASEIYGLTNQLRRAAVLIPSNIAEGASRNSSTERKRFFEISRSSLAEIDTQLEISKELNFYQPDDQSDVSQLMNDCFALLSKLIARTK